MMTMRLTSQSQFIPYPFYTSQQYDNGTREVQVGDVYRRQRLRITEAALHLTVKGQGTKKPWKDIFEGLPGNDAWEMKNKAKKGNRRRGGGERE